MPSKPMQLADHSSQVEELRPWVEAETGMDFSSSRIARLQSAVNKVLSGSTFADSLEQILAVPRERARFLERLAAELTVGESYFFRNEHHFRALREHVLPDILQANSQQREVRVWSAGCAAGEEPYSMAILFEEVLGSGHPWRVSILGTDLNHEFLARAREASYRNWSFRQTTIHQDSNYFTPDSGSYRLTPRVRDYVRFSYLNLVKDVYPSPLTGTLGLDLIVFRNVAIYLKEQVTREIIARFLQALRPGGWLLLGETEVSLAETAGFEVRRFDQATLHQKASTAPSTSSAVFFPTPVMSTVAVASPGVRGASGPRPANVGAPPIPDWLPLPKRRRLPEPVGESASERIEALLAQRQFEEAERAIERLSVKHRRAEYRLRLAQSLLASAATARAREVLDRCLAEEPMIIEAQLMHASFAEEAGHLEVAEQAYRRALYVDRKCALAHFHLALVLQQKGDVANAQRSMATTLRLIEGRAPHELVEYGEGMCFGRLKEMVEMLTAC